MRIKITTHGKHRLQNHSKTCASFKKLQAISWMQSDSYKPSVTDEKIVFFGKSARIDTGDIDATLVKNFKIIPLGGGGGRRHLPCDMKGLLAAIPVTSHTCTCSSFTLPTFGFAEEAHLRTRQAPACYAHTNM